jgi:hypothetical protein
MPGYAHINLLEVDDSVAGRAEGLEGRVGRGPKPEGGDGETAPLTWPE